MPALAAGASHAASTALTIPAETTPGLYYLLGRADGDGAVAETQEGNNGTFFAVTVGADLRIAWITGPGGAGLAPDVQRHRRHPERGRRHGGRLHDRLLPVHQQRVGRGRPAHRQPRGALARRRRDEHGHHRADHPGRHRARRVLPARPGRRRRRRGRGPGGQQRQLHGPGGRPRPADLPVGRAVQRGRRRHDQRQRHHAQQRRRHGGRLDDPHLPLSQRHLGRRRRRARRAASSRPWPRAQPVRPRPP